MKIFSILFAILAVIIGSSVREASAQIKTQPVGNIIVEVGSEFILETPVNDKIPLRSGDGRRIYSSHGREVFQISTVAVSTQPDEATLKIHIIDESDANEPRVRIKEIKIKRGEIQSFNLEIKSRYLSESEYLTTVSYEAQKETNEQPTTNN